MGSEMCIRDRLLPLSLALGIMNKSAILLIIASLLSSFSHAEEENAQDILVLKDLGESLAKLRSLPQGSKASAECPNEVNAKINYRQEQLLQSAEGLNKMQLTAVLGEPDYKSSNSHSWTYFFTSPRSRFQYGGGFPELTFSFTSEGIINDAICYYSR